MNGAKRLLTGSCRASRHLNLAVRGKPGSRGNTREEAVRASDDLWGDHAVLLDLRFLIDFLRSPSWNWGSEALRELLGALGLRGADPDEPAGRQELVAESGLRCFVVRDRRSGEPRRVEFPFVVPGRPGVAPDVMTQRFLDLTAASIRTVLGSPSPEGLEQESRLRWDLGGTSLALEANAAGEGVVLLAVERAAEPEDVA